jgi:hypothetical protein
MLVDVGKLVIFLLGIGCICAAFILPEYDPRDDINGFWMPVLLVMGGLSLMIISWI